MKSIKILIASAALVVASLSAFAQPYMVTTVQQGFPAATTITGSTATNFTTTVITSYTNITTAWSPSTAAFVNTTNITSSTNTIDRAKFYVGGQTSIPITIKTTANAASTANASVLFLLSADDSTYAATALGSQQLITYAQTGTTETVVNTNLQTYGFPFVEFLYATNAAAAVPITNIVIQGVQYPVQRSLR